MARWKIVDSIAFLVTGIKISGMNFQTIEHSIVEKFGVEALEEYKVFLAEKHRTKKCWTCQDYFPAKLYDAHLSQCIPGGKVFNPSFAPKFQRQANLPPAPIPLAMRVTKGSIYSRSSWENSSEISIETSINRTETDTFDHFRLHAIALNLGSKVTPRDRKRLQDVGHTELFLCSEEHEVRLYTGPVSAILTQSNRLEDIDPRRDLTIVSPGKEKNKRVGIDLYPNEFLKLKVSGFTPRKPVELIPIYFGIRLIPLK